MGVQFRGSGVPAENSQEPVWADWSTFTDIFREYAEYVFEYCISLLSDESEAAGATTVTFVSAQALLGHLENHDRLEAWLYALARRECTSKHPARWEKLPEGTGFGPGSGAGAAGTAGAGGGAGATAAAGLPRRNTERARTAADDDTDELNAISRTSERKMAARQALSAFSRLPEEDREVLAAFSALSPRDREVLDLVYWHGLSAVELPAILDISPQRAQTLLAAAVRRFREAAEDIHAAAGNSDNSGQEAEGSGDKLAATMPVARMPAAVWRRASRAVFDPDLRAYRESVVAHVGRLRPDGFPNQPAAPGARAQTLKVSAAVLVPAAAGLALLLYLAGSSSGAPSGQVALTPGGHSTAAGVHSSAGAARGRHGTLPVTSLFPGQRTHGVLPVATPGPSNGDTPSPGRSTGSSAPSSQPSSISKPPPSKSANPTPTLTVSTLPTSTPSSTPTTPSTSGSTSPSTTSTSSPTSVIGVIERLVPLRAVERFLI
jgi:RNA polymerase sigma factor (sigma-70 family)